MTFSHTNHTDESTRNLENNLTQRKKNESKKKYHFLVDRLCEPHRRLNQLYDFNSTIYFTQYHIIILFFFHISRLQLKLAYSHLDDFCKLPEATKELYLRNSESGNHGYVKPGQEKFDGKTKDIRHAYNICTLNQKLPEEVSNIRSSRNLKSSSVRCM